MIEKYTCEECGYTRNVVVHNKYKNKLWLHNKYIEESLSMAEIANMCGVSPTTINTWLNKYEIITRRRGRIRGK